MYVCVYVGVCIHARLCILSVKERSRFIPDKNQKLHMKHMCVNFVYVLCVYICFGFCGYVCECV